MQIGAAACAGLLLLLCGTASISAQKLDLSVDPKDSSISINLDGAHWFAASEVQLDTLSSTAGTLVRTGASQSTGTDAMGAYTSQNTEWAAAHSGQTLMITAVRSYPHDSGMLVFEQKFPNEIGPSGLAAKPLNKDSCRIAKGSFKLTSSSKGYAAFTPDASGAYTEHNNDYCDTEDPVGTYTRQLNFTSCQATCAELNCKCFDFKSNDKKLSARTLFPAFERQSDRNNSLDCFAYHGIFPGIKGCNVMTYQESHQGGSPLVIYDSRNASLPMAVFSPLNFPKAHHMASTDALYGAGVKATVEVIPAGWSQLFLLSAGHGINDGMMNWGDRMLRWTGKPRADMYLDQTHSTIGFWTDNGGYYHYATGDKKYGKNYGEVLPKVKQYHDSIGIPFGHWQFDSWFYPKDGGVNPGGGGGAVTNWTALPSVFPQGMAGIQDVLKLPTVMHNRQWSIDSDYIKNEPFEWYKSAKAAVPADPEAFFKWFFTQQEGWGLSMYEQDWMCTEYDDVDALQTNISLADLWLQGMADGAAGSGRTVQYCMPYPNDVLAAASHKAVTNARATGDYFHAKDQWAVGGTSLFYWAIGVLPFKDGFYSSTNKQVGGQTVGPELNPDRETLMATLSCAMVGPMDGIYLLNKTRIMTTCRQDGIVLKPDRPVSTSDWCFTQADPTCKVYHTYSDVRSQAADVFDARVHYHFNNDDKPMMAGMVYLREQVAAKVPYVVYNWYTREVTKLQQSNQITAGYEGHIYAIVSHVHHNGWAFIGEVDKYVTASSLRVNTVTAGPRGTPSEFTITANVTGVAGEVIQLCAVKSATMQLVCHSVSFTNAGSQLVHFGAGSVVEADVSCNGPRQTCIGTTDCGTMLPIGTCAGGGTCCQVQ